MAGMPVDDDTKELYHLAYYLIYYFGSHLTDAEGDKIFVNRCPGCNRLVRTPKAKLCLWCGNNWRQGTG
jgi:hypothetical protein